MSLRCPICKSAVAAESKTFPFCSERCRLVDLGNWLDGKYVLGDDEPEEKSVSEARARDDTPRREG